LNCAASIRVAGNGLSAETLEFLDGAGPATRQLLERTCIELLEQSTDAQFTSPSVVKVRVRSCARIQRSTPRTPTSTLALSCGAPRQHRDAVAVAQFFQ